MPLTGVQAWPYVCGLAANELSARAAGTVTVLKACGWKVGEAIKKVARRDRRLMPIGSAISGTKFTEGRADEPCAKTTSRCGLFRIPLAQMTPEEIASVRA